MSSWPGCYTVQTDCVVCGYLGYHCIIFSGKYFILSFCTFLPLLWMYCFFVIKVGTESEFDDNYREQAFKINPGKVNMTHGGNLIKPSTKVNMNKPRDSLHFIINKCLSVLLHARLHVTGLHTTPRLRDRSCCQASPNFSQISAFQD